MKKRCPSCKSETGLRKIILGLPAEPLDESKYLIGGCCITGNDPAMSCIKCGWLGWTTDSELETYKS